MHSISLHCDEHTSLKSDLEYFWRKKMDEAQCIMNALHELEHGKLKSIAGTSHEAYVKAFTCQVTTNKIK